MRSVRGEGKAPGADEAGMRAALSDRTQKLKTRQSNFCANGTDDRESMRPKRPKRALHHFYSLAATQAPSRETLSRVLESARVAGQARHTVVETAHGHSRCAGSEDPVPMWRWRRALGQSGEGVAEASAGGSEASP